MQRIPDNENICLRCTYGETFGLSQRPDEKEPRTWCMCQCPSIGGGNKGHRKQCKYFVTKKEEQT